MNPNNQQGHPNQDGKAFEQVRVHNCLATAGPTLSAPWAFMAWMNFS